MNRITHTEDRKIDWALRGERAFFWGLLLVVGATFYSAFALTTTSAPIPTAGIIRDATPVSTPIVRSKALATVLAADAAESSPCICDDSRSLR